MIPDLDIYRTANLLIEQYGADGAGMHAAQGPGRPFGWLDLRRQRVGE
jgi:hypothetical protein